MAPEVATKRRRSACTARFTASWRRRASSRVAAAAVSAMVLLLGCEEVPRLNPTQALPVRDPFAPPPPPKPKPKPPLPVFGAPKQPCVRIGASAGMKLYGVTADDCVYDITMDDLFRRLRCPERPVWWRAPGVSVDVPPGVSVDVPPGALETGPKLPYLPPCPALFGPYLDKLIRLKELKLTIEEYRSVGFCYDIPGWPCPEMECPALKPGWLGIREWGMTIPLLSPTGRTMRPCKTWRFVENDDLPRWAPRRQVRPFSSWDGVSPRCIPSCPDWVWEKHTLILRPTAKGVYIVGAPSEFSFDVYAPTDAGTAR